MIYSIGGMTIEINYKYEYGIEKCKRFLSEDKPLFSVEISEEEIAKEASLTPWNNKGLSEFDCVFRRIYNESPNYNRIVMHGASIMMNGKGVLFSAPSGTGKSTHIRLWGKKYGKDITVIDGDKPFISFENGKAYVWGSPRSGKEGWNNPISAPLKAIVFLERASENQIFKVSPTEIIDKAFMQFYIPKNKATAEKTITTINQLLGNVPIYILKCNMEIEAAEVAYNGIIVER